MVNTGRPNCGTWGASDLSYDGTMLVREFQINQQTGLLAPSATYMVGPMGPCCRINEQNQTKGYYPAGVTTTTPLTRGVTRWYVYDGLGSVIGELDDNNNINTSGQFDVYGAPRAGTQQGVAATSGQGYVGSLGHVTDQSIGGLIYMQARYYDPGVGRFVSEDPKGSGNNWYSYADDDPTGLVDSSGQNPGEDFFGAVLFWLARIAGYPFEWQVKGMEWTVEGIQASCKAISGAISAARTSAADELTDLVNSGPADAETVLEAEDVVETEAAVVQAEAALGEGEAIVQTAGAVGE